MELEERRKERLNAYFSEKIIKMFLEDDSEKRISYVEAVGVLEHTISQIGKYSFIKSK